MTFDTLAIIEPILRAIREEGYTTPTPIQAQAIPILLEGKDLLGCAQTGTGKTAAFAIPILQLLSNTPKQQQRPKQIHSLILTPTRELALQIKESFQSYGRHTQVKTEVIFGGVNQNPQVAALRRGVDVLIATPGRLLDLMQQGEVFLDTISCFVLDEADRMLDMGFVKDVQRILKKLPHNRQSLFFSATMPMEIQSLAATILKNPVSVTITPEATTAELIQQYVYHVDKNQKFDLLLDLLQDPKITSAIVFTRTKHGADKVVKLLSRHRIRAEAIHGNKSQNHRQRALANFKTEYTRILVATDIAARGIDIDALQYVINFEIPNIPETYIHRIGRTGRAGASGTAYTFCDIEEVNYLRDIERLMGKKVPIKTEHPFAVKSPKVSYTLKTNTTEESIAPVHYRRRTVQF